MRHDPITSNPAPPVETRELIWLIGQPSLEDYLQFYRTKVLGGDSVDPGALVDEWRAANDIYHDLSSAEAGLAERIGCRPLPKSLHPLEQKVREHPWFRRSFSELPISFAMVELDKLICSQIHVEHGHYDLGTSAMGRSLRKRFEFCLPLQRDLPPVRVQRLGDHRWLFSSPSTDLRERSPMLLRGERLDAIATDAPLAAMVGLPVGFGANFMSAVRSGKRIVLQNGYHRAYALRRAGFSHAPCILEEVTRKDELKVGGDETVNQDPEFYFGAPRPPLLKDFFDPRFAKPLCVRRIDTIVEVEIKVRSGTATDWD